MEGEIYKGKFPVAHGAQPGIKVWYFRLPSQDTGRQGDIVERSGGDGEEFDAKLKELFK